MSRPAADMDTVLDEAGELREEGNALFARGDYTAACAKYEVAAPGPLRPASPSRPPALAAGLIPARACVP